MTYKNQASSFRISLYLLIMKRILPLLFSLFCLEIIFAQDHDTAIYKEKYRPQFHFSPPKNWINDPNGLVYFEGEYHLFYQHNPFGNTWGHMTWGHAVSTNLVDWTHLPIAIPEENGIMIFSGTVVVDQKNSSGFGGETGKALMVAIYTGHQEGLNQSQHMAYSVDKGRTWTKYDRNPVLDLGKKDFRDPKVFWYEQDKKWVMVVALPQEKKVQLYRSQNLKDWTYMSDFGPAGDTSGIWECPDLFRVPVQHSRSEYKWVLMHSPAPYMQYFVGDFDGTSFKNETPVNEILRPDYGPDYYAAIVYNNLPTGSAPISIGWVNNWDYANDIPTSPWKGAMSLPRTLQVKKMADKWVLVQEPIGALANKRTSPTKWNNRKFINSFAIPDLGNSWEIDLQWTPSTAGKSGIRIGGNENPVCLFYFDPLTREIVFERGIGNQFKHPSFNKLKRFSVPITVKENQISVRVFYDNSILEVYINNGEQVITAQVFPEKNNPAIEVFDESGRGKINSLQAWKIQSVW
jgi:fructan beta-fructosidase